MRCFAAVGAEFLAGRVALGAAKNGDDDGRIATGGDEGVEPTATSDAPQGTADLGAGADGAIAEIPDAVRDGLARLLRKACTTIDCVLNLDFELQRVVGGIEAGRLTIDLDVLESCLAQPGVGYIFDSRLVSGYGIDEQCAGLFVPLSPLGAPCDTDFACIDGFCLRSDFSRSRPHYVAGGCGVCAPRGGTGQACSGRGWIGGDLECADGLICLCQDGSAGCPAGICGPPATATQGERCASQIACEDGLRCVYGESEGTCEVPKATGLSCESAAQCASEICLEQDDGGACSSGLPGSACTESTECEPTSHCVDRVCTIAALGTPCYEDCSDDSVCVWEGNPTCLPRADRGGACRGSEQCPPDNLCMDGTCGRYLALGEACGAPGVPDVCPMGTSCAGGSCQRLPTIGEACTGDCAVGACQNGICEPLVEGSPCDDASVPGGGDPCGAGLECGGSYTDGRCESRPSIGEPCLDGWCDTGAFCASDGLCSAICVLDNDAAPPK